MSWRTVIVSKRAKLDFKMNYMVIRGEETRRIFLDEIAVLIIENPAVSMTGCLLEKLIEKKIKVILCDSKRSPAAELVPYYGSYDSSRKIRRQIAWSEEIKGQVWTAIVYEKIANQAQLLNLYGKQKETALLEKYLIELEYCDSSNREGHAAKVYFNALFGLDFTRDSNCPVNSALDYGYSIILSAFNREIANCGYLTQLGLHHENVFNYFNLSSDLMEPYRPLVDKAVVEMNITEFGKDIKYSLVNLLNESVTIAGKKQTVLNSIGIYVRSVFDALEKNDSGRIEFVHL